MGTSIFVSSGTVVFAQLALLWDPPVWGLYRAQKGRAFVKCRKKDGRFTTYDLHVPACHTTGLQ